MAKTSRRRNATSSVRRSSSRSTASSASPSRRTRPVTTSTSGPFEVERSPWYVVKKVLLFLPAIFLFILAIQLMKSGAAAVGPSIEGQFPFANGVSTLGTGWLGAYFVLSGSPVAATAISLFGAGTITKLQAFTMLSGLAPGRVVHRAAHRVPLRDASTRTVRAATRSASASRR